MAARAFKIPSTVKTVEGPGIARFVETNPATFVPLTTNDIDMFAGLGGDTIEIPFIASTTDNDTSDISPISDETKEAIEYAEGDREVTITLTLQGNYSTLNPGAAVGGGVASATKTSGTCVLTTASPHGLIVGQGILVECSGGAATDYNGFHIITAVTSTTITFPYGTSTAGTTTGTVKPCTYDSVRRLIKSSEAENGGRTFKLAIYKKIKPTGVSTTAVGFEKLIYFNCRTVPDFSDTQGGDSRQITLTIKATKASTVQSQSPGGQTYHAIPVNSVQATASAETFELQPMASTA